jgi:hypothetical protein
MNKYRQNIFRQLFFCILCIIGNTLSVSAVTIPSDHDFGDYDWQGFTGDVNVLYNLSQTDTETYTELYEQMAVQMFLYFTDVVGLGDEAACGVLGNFQEESGLDPTRLQTAWPTWDDAVLGTTGIGLAQFTYYSLQAGLGNAALAAGTEWTDMEVQLAYAADGAFISGSCWTTGNQLVNSNVTSFEQFKNADIYTAAALFCVGYERPQLYYKPSTWEARANSGTTIYELVKSHSGETYDAKNNPDLFSNQISSSKKSSTDDSSEESEKIPTEYELEGMPDKNYIAINQTEVSNQVDLTTTENYTRAQIAEQVEAEKSATVLNWVRIGFAGTGLFLMILASILLLAFFVDRSANFLDFSLVTICSLGFIKLNYDGYDNWTAEGSDVSKFFGIWISIFTIGVVLATGAGFNIIWNKIVTMGNIVVYIWNKIRL